MENDLLQRTSAYARRIIGLFASLPRTAVAQVLGNQFLRSGTSVGANYREANQGRSRAELIPKMGDCLKELSETEYWLELLQAEKIGDRAVLTDLICETKELIAIFTTIIKRTKARST